MPPNAITDGLSQTLCVGERSENLQQGRGMATWVGSVPGANLWSCAPNPYEPDAGTCVEEAGAGMILRPYRRGAWPGRPLRGRQPVHEPPRRRMLFCFL